MPQPIDDRMQEVLEGLVTAHAGSPGCFIQQFQKPGGFVVEELLFRHTESNKTESVPEKRAAGKCASEPVACIALRGLLSVLPLRSWLMVHPHPLSVLP